MCSDPSYQGIFQEQHENGRWPLSINVLSLHLLRASEARAFYELSVHALVQIQFPTPLPLLTVMRWGGFGRCCLTPFCSVSSCECISETPPLLHRINGIVPSRNPSIRITFTFWKRINLGFLEIRIRIIKKFGALTTTALRTRARCLIVYARWEVASRRQRNKSQRLSRARK